MLLQEFNLEIPNKVRKQNMVADHLSRFPSLIIDPFGPIIDNFPDEHLLAINGLP
jgi:hypothetical protein